MPKRILEKTALEASRLRIEGAHAVGGVPGLYLQILGGSRVWVFRYVHMRQRRRMGRRIDGAHVITSDNPNVRTVDVLDGTHPVRICGRVVYGWNGRRF